MWAAELVEAGHAGRFCAAHFQLIFLHLASQISSRRLAISAAWFSYTGWVGVTAITTKDYAISISVEVIWSVLEGAANLSVQHVEALPGESFIPGPTASTK
jgi:hypothetical protein